MGLGPKETHHRTRSSLCGLCNGTITTLLSTGVPRICSHQQVDDHRKREYHTAEHTTTKVRQYTRLDSTHPDTYSQVGFSGCLHLWWIPLLTSELLTPELCVTSVTMKQFPSPQDGAPPWAPTNRGHEITSRPLKRNPETYCLAQPLAQAEGSRSGEPPSPRRGLERASREQRGISLRQDPSRLGEMFARSKIERVAWAASRVKGALGESLSISPRRDWLAWARLAEMASTRPRHWTPEHSSSRDGPGNWRNSRKIRRLYSSLAFPFPLFTRWARQNPLILDPSFSLFLAMEEDKYAKELEVAVRVVHVACALCGRVQERLLETSNDHVVSKDDDSPVTVAGMIFFGFGVWGGVHLNYCLIVAGKIGVLVWEIK
ncbi:diphosphonucleoside phosphohydrolase [Vigna unguiculata]|uniref:Diphosphonucleoside phosphohydrolase n=1 Tax=Vigna unguiculata TaxID=3917 RepID=A0A4D6LEX3_VIGUN|nr:diphosphonucleoside phosphohydrolase [Vigna unguiculata]